MAKDKIYYVGLRVNSLCTKTLINYFELPKDSKFHTTIIYSRSWFPYKGQESREYHIRPPYRTDVFFGKTVLCFGNKPLIDRHEEFLKLGGSRDFEKYIPHITLGEGLPFIEHLPKFDIILCNEYYRTWIEE